MNIIFVLSFVIFPLSIYYLMKKVGIPLLKLDIPSLVVVSLFVFTYIGILPLYFGLDAYRYSIGITDKDIILQMFLFSITAITGLVIGFISAKKLFGNSHSSLTFNIRLLSSREIFVLVLLLVFVFTVLNIYLSKIPQTAIFVAFSDGISEANVARTVMGNDFSGKYHWYSVFMHDLANLLTFVFFSSWLLVKKRLHFFLFLVAFSISSFSAMMAIEKAPFVWLLVGLFFVHIFVKNNAALPVKKILFFLVIISSALVLLYIFFGGSRDIESAITSASSRAFTGQIAPAYFYLEFFPAYQDFLLGRSFTNPGGILPFEPYRLTVEVANWKFPEEASKGIVSSSPTAFWGELYANFGSLGVIFISPLVGFVLYSFSVFVKKIENTPLKIGFVVWLILHYKDLAFTGISAFMIDFYMIIITLIVISTYAVVNKMKIRLQSKSLL